MITEPGRYHTQTTAADRAAFLANAKKTGGRAIRAGRRIWEGIDLAHPLEEPVRIAVAGASRSGKTVFLTSLIDHLRNHNPKRFRLQPGLLTAKAAATITGFEELDVPSSMTPFPYEAFRRSLVEDGNWPSKTKDTYQYRMRVYRDDGIAGTRRPVRLSFVDFPGERIADAPICTLSYEAWSDYVFRTLLTETTYPESRECFLSVASDPARSGEEAVAAYKVLLARSLQDFHTALTPSSFALCPVGTSPAAGAPIERLVRERITGIREDRQFAPLSREIRQSRPELSKTFESAYLEYRDQLVAPLFAELARCDRLALLVNIPEILQSGVGAYNDFSDVTHRVLDVCCPKPTLVRSLGRLVGNRLFRFAFDERYRPGGISKIAFVATQADRIRASEVTRLRTLTEELRDNVMRKHPHIRFPVEAFTCVAVQATESREGKLLGRPAQLPEKADMVTEYAVSSLPASWPPNWKPDDYVFPEVLPHFNRNKHQPPRHQGLDKVFDYLTS